MKIQTYWKKLNDMKTFKIFTDENPSAYLCSGFFVIDKEGKDNKQHFDFYIPGKKIIESFEMENQGQRVPIDPLDSRIPEPLEFKDNFSLGLDEIEEFVEKALKENDVKSKVQKIMASLQREIGKGKKPFLICTVFLSGLGMANIHFDVLDNKVVSFEKKSLFNMMKRVK